MKNKLNQSSFALIFLATSSIAVSAYYYPSSTIPRPNTSTSGNSPVSNIYDQGGSARGTLLPPLGMPRPNTSTSGNSPVSNIYDQGGSARGTLLPPLGMPRPNTSTSGNSPVSNIYDQGGSARGTLLPPLGMPRPNTSTSASSHVSNNYDQGGSSRGAVVPTFNFRKNLIAKSAAAEKINLKPSDSAPANPTNGDLYYNSSGALCLFIVAPGDDVSNGFWEKVAGLNSAGCDDLI